MTWVNSLDMFYFHSLVGSTTTRKLDIHDTCLGIGHSPSPVDRADCMCLHGRPCVWLPFAAVNIVILKKNLLSTDSCFTRLPGLVNFGLQTPDIDA